MRDNNVFIAERRDIVRSIPYILGGKPRCFADCKDYMKGHDLKEVTVDLKTAEETAEHIFIKRLLGFFTWDFSDLIVTYEEQFGGIIPMEPEERQDASVKNANRRLGRRINDFKQAGIELKKSEQRFNTRILHEEGTA